LAPNLRVIVGYDCIRENVTKSQDTPTNASVLDCDVRFQATSLDNIHLTTQDEIRKIILKSPNKSCQLDPLPTWLLKDCIDILLPLITTLINRSLIEGMVPIELKRAVIRPLLKKPDLNTDEHKNYRPVSNLSYISKILEKVVGKRIDAYLLENDLYDSFQSAYRTGHSTETTLLKVQSDIAEELDKGSTVALVMLDLSAAFDTIDHDILIKRFEHSYGITSKALSWMKSYLTDRSQCVCVGESFSKYVKLCYGVPQGSVLGPRMYCLYSVPVGNIIRQHGLSYHIYADDTQLYIKVNTTALNQTKRSLELCLADIDDWMKNNLLKLNQDKTDFILFSPRRNADPRLVFEITLDNTKIKTSDSVRNLGIEMDCHLTMERHISKIVRTSNYLLRNMWHIRKFLNKKSCKTLVQGTITSRLDYANSLLYGLPQHQILKLQKIQNSAARLITKTRKREHITPILKDLHWLPIRMRPIYKILTLTHKSIHSTSPDYLSDMLKVYHPARPLRSQNRLLLTIQDSNQTKYSKRSFRHSAPHLWNKLPQDLRDIVEFDIFKRKLKTYLFEK